jgi:hypothetical protein
MFALSIVCSIHISGTARPFTSDEEWKYILSKVVTFKTLKLSPHVDEFQNNETDTNFFTYLFNMLTNVS